MSNLLSARKLDGCAASLEFVSAPLQPKRLTIPKQVRRDNSHRLQGVKVMQISAAPQRPRQHNSDLQTVQATE